MSIRKRRDLQRGTTGSGVILGAMWRTELGHSVEVRNRVLWPFGPTLHGSRYRRVLRCGDGSSSFGGAGHYQTTYLEGGGWWRLSRSVVWKR